MKLYLDEPIGRIIQEEVFKLNISLSELSDRMHISEKKLLLFFNSKTLDVYLLYRWSCLLKIDFFALYSIYLQKNVTGISNETTVHSYKFDHVEKYIIPYEL